MCERIAELAVDAPGALRVYRVWLGAPPPGDREEALLAPTESARADTFRLPFLRARFIWCRLALRTLLAAQLGEEPERVVLHASPTGRPFAAAADIDFSVSHSDDLALLAIRRGDGRVGVDVERVVPFADRAGVAQIAFTARERADLSRGGEVSLEAFYRMWTCKEAFLKAIGSGLLTDPRDIEIDLTNCARPTLRRGPSWRPSAFASFCPMPGFIGAVALLADD